MVFYFFHTFGGGFTVCALCMCAERFWIYTGLPHLHLFFLTNMQEAYSSNNMKYALKCAFLLTNNVFVCISGKSAVKRHLQ